jgi:hypothetical protein
MQRLVNGVKQFASGGGSIKSALLGQGGEGAGLLVMAAKNYAAWYFEAVGLQVDGLWRATEPYPAELPRKPWPPTMKLYRRLGQGWI